MTQQVTARIAKRLKIFEPALMRYGHAIARIHLLDLSYTGALVHGPTPPPPGTIVRIECKTLAIAARVAWVRNTKYGVAFLTPIGADDLSVLIDAVPIPPPVVRQIGTSIRSRLTAHLVSREKQRSSHQATIAD